MVEREGYHKNLSKATVKEIREAYLNGTTQTRLAMTYGVHIKLIWQIIHLHIYKNVPVDDTYMVRLQERLG